MAAIIPKTNEPISVAMPTIMPAKPALHVLSDHPWNICSLFSNQFVCSLYVYLLDLRALTAKIPITITKMTYVQTTDFIVTFMLS